MANRWTEADKAAVFELLKDGHPYSHITQVVGTPKATIHRWVHNPQCVLGSGNTCVFTKQQEDLLAKACIYAADLGFGFGRTKLSDIVRSFVEETGIRNPFSRVEPGIKW